MRAAQETDPDQDELVTSHCAKHERKCSEYPLHQLEPQLQTNVKERHVKHMVSGSTSVCRLSFCDAVPIRWYPAADAAATLPA